MKYLSVCSGIEAATVAWHPLGWEPVAFSETARFPAAVLAHHYPTVPNYGDLTRFKEWPDATVDVLVGGTPCQSFSVAGLRAGLDDPRGSLMLVYLALARRARPRWVVWENVPGVLSNDGGGRLAPCSGGWQTSGMGSPTAFLTLSTSDWPSDGSVCSLSAVMETGDVPRRFYLSAKACQGILRRAENRGKRLPRSLAVAVQAVASGQTLTVTAAS